MSTQQVAVIELAALPAEAGWLAMQAQPVIAYGENGETANADVLVADFASAQKLAQRVAEFPIAALTLVQVLRMNEKLSLSQALDLESLAYATLQAGPEYAAWQGSRDAVVELPGQSDDTVVLSHQGSRIDAVLNRADTRNAISVEMRDAWVEALQLLEADTSITELRFSARGACFSVGGELAEFGSTPDPATAHWVRTVQSPARMMAKLGGRVSCQLHGACIGSGIELPAFASRIVAHHKSFFQLPELQFGLMPGAGGTVSISRRIGRQRTAWLVLSGKRINAKTALEWGLVDEIVDELSADC